MLVANADLFSGLNLHADISTRVGSRARLHYGQLGLKAGVSGLERIDPLGNVIPNGPGTERSMLLLRKKTHSIMTLRSLSRLLSLPWPSANSWAIRIAASAEVALGVGFASSRALNRTLVYGRLCHEPRFIRLRPEAEEQMSMNR